jgi:hypothetical protein
VAANLNDVISELELSGLRVARVDPPSKRANRRVVIRLRNMSPRMQALLCVNRQRHLARAATATSMRAGRTLGPGLAPYGSGPTRTTLPVRLTRPGLRLSDHLRALPTPSDQVFPADVEDRLRR